MTIAQTTEETLRLTKESLAHPDGALAKNVTIATGLSAYDLQAPAKNLYPTITPLRNAIPRVQRLNPGDAARWRTISSITGSGFDAMGWVPEGQRSASMSYVANLQVASYMTLGEEDTVTFEAEAAAQGYEDINATATLRLLQKTMRKEETGLLGGNSSLALGTPGTPALSARRRETVPPQAPAPPGRRPAEDSRRRATFARRRPPPKRCRAPLRPCIDRSRATLRPRPMARRSPHRRRRDPSPRARTVELR